MEKKIKKANPESVKKEYPITDLVENWFFCIKEISTNYYCIEGIDLYGRKIARMGSEVELDNLQKQCIEDAKSISDQIWIF